ncbi:MULTISPECIES: hypothetical protein [unclassified Streptomyces]|uniref:hypothetical protein n=1 Tax=unclassified Streptomyces TaxID=2593676 RepID=UPI0023657421|nr:MULTISPECIES: hypothetical protein [unclassified Streptomyces]MDF3143921.1 hypothetical protein [Streptomyces sp. T21Q-yed]WDF36125.1 hypothetical protein PBV52_04765 [Streptomyces sp. T12]
MKDRERAAMQDADDLERRCLRAVRELGEEANVRIEYEYVSPSAATSEEVDLALRELDANGRLHLESALHHQFFVPREVHVLWESEDHPTLGGEFQLHSTVDSASHPEYVPRDVNLKPRRQKILSELRAIDSLSQSGMGAVAGVRLAAEPPFEMWYYSKTERMFQKLNLSPSGYLETVLATKGTTGWQYLFADVDFKDSWLEEVGSNLQTMLETFPTLFPEYDYEPLRARLEARL